MVSAEIGGQEKGALIEAIEESLRPLMRMVLTYGVSYIELLELVRGLYIGAVRDQLKEQGRPVTVARLALMAGVTRGEAEQILFNRTQRRELRSQTINRVDELSVVLTVWHDDKRFSTPYGVPLDLSLSSERGFRTIDDLIQVAAAHLDRDLVIDELVTAGCVEVHDNKFVRCTSRTFVPTGIDVSRISRVGRTAGALNSTFVHNLLRKQDEPPYVERTVVTEFLVNRAYRDEALTYLREEGTTFLDKLDRWTTDREQGFKDPTGMRYGVGLFFYEERSSEREPEITESKLTHGHGAA